MRRTAAILKPLVILLVASIPAAPALMAETSWDAVEDGSFELGSPNAVWNEYSQHSGIVIRQDVTIAHTGVWYASLGSDYPIAESAFVSQDILLGAGAATISFWWTRPFESENNQDIISLIIDGAVVWLDQPYPGIGPLDQWILEEIDISGYADGGNHQIMFEMSSSGTSNTTFGTLWFVDDVMVMTNDPEPLQADFNWTPSNPMVGEEIQFWDTSTGGADQWFWDFGDGQTSNLKDPIHVYFEPGEYTVSLTAVRSGDGTQSFKTYTVVIGEGPLSVDFSWQPPDPLPGQTVVFFPDFIGGPDSWTWNFGDGTTSDAVNPEHIFDEPGQYVVLLDVFRSSDGATGSIQHDITVIEPLFPEFTWTPGIPGIGEITTFTDTSGGLPDSWFWEFADGATSEEQHPTHLWEAPGDYPVTLTISQAEDPEVSVTHTVTVSDDSMTAAFTWQPFDPYAEQPVSFFDQSTGNPDTWLWQFGDGLAGEQQNPVHTFDESGEYIVTLTISRSDDPTVTSTVEQIITVFGPIPQVRFEVIPAEPFVGTVVEFIDLSEGDVIAWEWDFGDGATSTEQSPSHIYSDAGDYQVVLSVNPGMGGITPVLKRWLTVSDDPYLALFSWAPEEPHVGQAVEFFDQSQGDPLAWHWAFGDGRSSRQQHPVHWFEQGGAFNVTLTVAFDPDGTTLRSMTQTVVVADRPLEADFFWIPLIPKAGENVNFNDVSQGRPASWLWLFGDGSTSHAQHPAHTYETPGQYTISLTIERGDTKGSRKNNFRFSHPICTASSPRAQSENSQRRQGYASNFPQSPKPNLQHIWARNTRSYSCADPKVLSTDTRTRTIRVTQDVEIDFNWSPQEPRALEPVQFTEHINDPIGGRFWVFGDSQTSSEENPTHTYQQPGIYRVQLWTADVAGNILATAEHEISVRPPNLNISLVVSNAHPDIGETIAFQLGGIDSVEGVLWAFGGLGCDGNPGRASCIPSDTDDCLTTSFVFATPGLKPVRAWIQLEGGAEIGPFSTPVRVEPRGRCATTPEADFNWWPAEPVAGQPVRCVDHSVGPPESWTWTFDDGSSSNSQHATHVFETPGEHVVELAITNANGQSTIAKSISVGAAEAICGDGICQPGENSWSCPQDCLDDTKGTGRIGRKHTNLMVPAAVGGVHGANGTYWVTEGSIVNPGQEDAQVIVEFVADNDPETPRIAGPATIPPHSAIHFDNIVGELFGTHVSGSLWIDADKPVIANTRTFNRTGGATFGQGIGGITRKDVLGEGDGSVYIIGLKQTDRFRTNFLFQEVSGHHAIVNAQVFDSTGILVVNGYVNVPAKTKRQKPIADLGVTELDAGYVLISVHGEGKVATMASVVDQITGDATTLDAVHTLQTGAGGPAKADGEDEEGSHFLVAVVARTPGANNTVWRSEVSILNSDEADQVLELRYLPSDGEMLTATRELAAGELFFSEDVIEDIFPEAANGAGSLHVLAQNGLVVNSRTYNLLPDESTVGQAIPGLTTGDMARPGEVWLLDSLKQTQDFRCNMGFAEFEGADAEVTVVLFDTDGASLFFLASKKYSVPAFGQFQVNKIFKDMGLTRDYREAIAYVSVASEGGALYVYASVVDNAVGDGTTILGKRQ